MLNDIRLHLDSDEAVQSQIERRLARKINAFQEANIKAFNLYVPSIGKILTQLPFERLSVFVDKHEQTNVVDFQSGTTLYNPNVDNNVRVQTEAWQYNSALLKSNDLASPARVSLQANTFTEQQNYANELREVCTRHPIDTLVILGLGKGAHIEQLFDFDASDSLDTTRVKYLVIYEPDWEVLRCTLSIFDWAKFLRLAEQRNLQIFFQVGTDLQQIFDDITELQEKSQAKQILFFKHTNLPVFMQVMTHIQQGKWGRSAGTIANSETGHQHHHLQLFSALNASQWHPSSASNSLFNRNMDLFAEHFPEIHAVFLDYKPRCWETLTHKDSGAINLYNRYHGNFYASYDPVREGQLLAQHFTQYPNLDGLVFGYEGDKLRHYIHNTFIRQADMILRENAESVGELPEEVKALMVFGLGSGYMLEALYKDHNVQNLIICEPNPDFFYGALHAIDWAPIFERAKQGENKLYINIGEASSRLFKDLMSQFLVIGPHLLNETFIMQSYHNPMLHQVLCEVRQQLQVIFAMGENFDHVAFGIAHTVNAMHNRTPALRYDPAQYLSLTNKQTPIFLVGNGPSLDSSIDIIKAHKGESIVVSCGTALQALHKNGIRPDFHGEVEQNRANFDWASRINDSEYLQEITLISVNGIHPDTCKLYKNVLIAFKSGESSTHSLLAMLPEKSFHCVDHAYPTVTNMAMSFFLAMGFEQLYLIGVDLGFADQSKHHSSASGYYENGKQIYDYQRVHASNIRTKGNRQDWVFTKTEFNISRMIIEQLLLESRLTKTQHLECFNLSDGVFIEGALPLDPDSVLVTATEQQKQQALIAMDSCFMAISSDIPEMYAKSYKQDFLTQQLATLQGLSCKGLCKKEDVYKLVNDLSELLFDAKRRGESLFFYYFFNSINYLNAALTKASLQSNDTLALQDCARLLHKWRVFLADAKATLINQFSIIDVADAFGTKRERLLLNSLVSDKNVVKYYSSHTLLVDTLMIDIAASRQTGVELISSFEDVVEIIALNKINTPLLIDVYAVTDLNLLIGEFTKAIERGNFSSSTNIGLVLHDFAMLTLFSEQQPEICANICLLYCSPLLETQKNNQALEAGVQDFLLADQYLHVLQARAQDLHAYSQIIIKPRFSEQGLQSAYSYNRERANTFDEPLVSSTMNNCALEHDIAHDACQVLDHTSKEEVRKVLNNEYESVSVARINDAIVSRLQKNNWFMFKRYAALSKQNQAGGSDHNTLKDRLENRGVKMHRLPFDFELIGDWQSRDTLASFCSDI